MTFEEWKDRFVKKLMDEAEILEEIAQTYFDDLGFDGMDDILDEFVDDPEGAALEEIANWYEPHDDEELEFTDMDQFYDEYEPWDGDYE